MKNFFQLQRGSLSRAADEINCQRSFLSQVIHSKAQLTADLAFQLCEHWRLSLGEREYFLALVDLERASSASYKRFLQKKVENLKVSSLKKTMTQKFPEGERIPDLLYFSSYHWATIHLLTSIKKYQTVAAIAERLKLRKTNVQNYLEQLEKWGYVSRKGSRWEYVGGDFHLRSESPLHQLYGRNWRMRAMADMEAQGDGFHFSRIHTISQANITVAKRLIVEFATQLEDIFNSGADEECVVFNCDFFKAF